MALKDERVEQCLVGVNSKCAVQSKRRCESHETCVCIVGFLACGCQKKNVVYETECRHVTLCARPGRLPLCLCVLLLLLLLVVVVMVVCVWWCVLLLLLVVVCVCVVGCVVVVVVGGGGGGVCVCVCVCVSVRPSGATCAEPAFHERMCCLTSTEASRSIRDGDCRL